MAKLDKLIVDINQEEELSRKETLKHFVEQEKQYKSLVEKFNSFKDENKKSMDSILKGLDKLVATKHTIEKALEQTENLTGLPIAYKQHQNFVEMVSKMTELIHNIDSKDELYTFSYEKLHNDIISMTESIENGFKTCSTDFSQPQALYNNINLFKNLMDSTDSETRSMDEND